jgi:hypothetical protein
MKKIGHFIRLNKDKSKKKSIDEKTIFFLFNKVIRKMYGEKGVENLKAERYAGETIFFSSREPLWAADLLVNQAEAIEKINRELGSPEIKKLKSCH